MKKLLTSTVLAAAFAVVGSIAFAQNINLETTVINAACSDSSTVGLCYFSMKPLPFDGSVLIANQTINQIRAVNPGIDDYIIDGMLPRLHVIATTKTES